MRRVVQWSYRRRRRVDWGLVWLCIGAVLAVCTVLAGLGRF